MSKHFPTILFKIFTWILRNSMLPIGNLKKSQSRSSYLFEKETRWIIATLGNGSSSLQLLRELLFVMKTFLHPSNDGTFQENLIDFIHNLTVNFIKRLDL